MPAAPPTFICSSLPLSTYSTDDGNIKCIKQPVGRDSYYNICLPCITYIFLCLCTLPGMLYRIAPLLFLHCIYSCLYVSWRRMSLVPYHSMPLPHHNSSTTLPLPPPTNLPHPIYPDRQTWAGDREKVRGRRQGTRRKNTFCLPPACLSVPVWCQPASMPCLCHACCYSLPTCLLPLCHLSVCCFSYTLHLSLPTTMHFLLLYFFSLPFMPLCLPVYSILYACLPLYCHAHTTYTLSPTYIYG